MRFDDRRHGGHVLGEAVCAAQPVFPIVLALPKGGVPVAIEVFKLVGGELDLLVVKKVGVPGHPELAMGAVAEGNVVVKHGPVISGAGITTEVFDNGVANAQIELEEAVAAYRTSGMRDISGKTAIIVDDGLATGSTARAAIEVARAREAGEVWLAVPVAPPSAVSEMEPLVDRIVAPLQPHRFGAVGAWYRDFTQVHEAEVRRLIDEAS